MVGQEETDNKEKMEVDSNTKEVMSITKETDAVDKETVDKEAGCKEDIPVTWTLSSLSHVLIPGLLTLSAWFSTMGNEEEEVKTKEADEMA